MEYLQLLDILSDIKDVLNVIVSPFLLIYDVISTLISGVAGIIYIIGTIGSVVLSICALLPSPLFETFMLYVGVYVSILGFKLVKGII